MQDARGASIVGRERLRAVAFALRIVRPRCRPPLNIGRLTQKGRDPLVFYTNGSPFRAFLEGRVDGERYQLLLHLSNMELKRPREAAPVDEA